MSIDLDVYPFHEKVFTTQELKAEIQRQMADPDFIREFEFCRFRKPKFTAIPPDTPIKRGIFYVFGNPDPGYLISLNIIPLERADDLSREYLRWRIQFNNIGGHFQKKLIQQVEFIPYYYAVSSKVASITDGRRQSYFQLLQALGTALAVLTNGLIAPTSDAFGPPDSLYFPEHFQNLQVPQLASPYAPRQLCR
jgi:hypothetical protein